MQTFPPSQNSSYLSSISSDKKLKNRIAAQNARDRKNYYTKLM